MKNTYLITLLLLVAFSTTQAQNQSHSNTVFIYQSSEPSIDYQFHDGVAFLTNGSYLKGRFQYNGRSTFTYRADSQTPRQRIGFSMIRRLALAGADTLVTTRSDSTVFIRLGTRLYRLLADGPTMVLDRKFLVTEQRGKLDRTLWVLNDAGNLLRFNSLQKLNNWFTTYAERTGKKLPDVYRNQHEIIKAVAQLD